MLVLVQCLSVSVSLCANRWEAQAVPVCSGLHAICTAVWMCSSVLQASLYNSSTHRQTEPRHTASGLPVGPYVCVVVLSDDSAKDQ